MSLTVSLTPRQRAVVSVLPQRCACVADIGCDHGRLGAYLLQTGRTERIIAADISVPSLHKAEQLAETLGISAAFSFRAGDGLSVLEPGEVQAVVIGGMGAFTIMRILEAAPQLSAEAFVLQPMGHECSLRRWLLENGFFIADDRVAQEGKRFYHILLVRRGRQSYTEREIYLPVHSLRSGSEEAFRFAQGRRDALKKILAYSADAEKAAEYRLLSEALGG